MCYYHGGAPGSGGRGRPIITGRYSHAFASDDEEGKALYEAFRDDVNLEELANEVAILRAKFHQYQKRNSKQMDDKTIGVFLSFLDGIGKLVEKRHKIKYGEQVTLTTRHFDDLAAKLLVLVREIYGEDDRYTRFLAECRKLQVAASDRAGGAAR